MALSPTLYYKKKKRKNLQKRREDQELHLWAVWSGQTWQQALLHLCVWEAAESHELDSGTSRALKILFIESESGGQCKLVVSRMWAMGERGRGLLWPFSQGPGPALAAENCWSYELLPLTTRTFLPKHRTNPTALVWWCDANRLKQKVSYYKLYSSYKYTLRP